MTVCVCMACISAQVLYTGCVCVDWMAIITTMGVWACAPRLKVRMSMSVRTVHVISHIRSILITLAILIPGFEGRGKPRCVVWHVKPSHCGEASGYPRAVSVERQVCNGCLHCKMKGSKPRPSRQGRYQDSDSSNMYLFVLTSTLTGEETMELAYAL